MINDVLGIDTSDLLLEPDTNPYLFNSIGAGSSSLSSLGVEQYAEAAFVVAERYFETPQRIEVEFGCLPMSVNDGCADQMIRQLGAPLISSAAHSRGGLSLASTRGFGGAL